MTIENGAHVTHNGGPDHVTVGNVRLHCHVSGAGEPVLLLHGFPDFWYGWRHLIPLLQTRCRVIAPDLRGYNLSGRPSALEDYAPERLVGDVAALVRHYGGGDPLRIIANDWGGVVAWMLAETQPSLIAGMVILNAPHPAVLAAALRDDPAQRAAAGYMERLRTPNIETMLAAGNHAALWGAMAELAGRGRLTDTDKAAYLNAWSQPGALTAMLSWYRAASFLDPKVGRPMPTVPIRVPTLLLWGATDGALLPSLAQRHSAICPDADIRILDGIGHWPQVEAPDLVADLAREFLRL